MLLDVNTTSSEYTAYDGIVVKKYVHGLEGGVVLNMTGFADPYVYEGHGVIFDGTDYKPQPVDGTLDTQLVGVVRSTTRASKPSTGVMTGGYINSKAAKYPFNVASIAALKALGIYDQPDNR